MKMTYAQLIDSGIKLKNYSHAQVALKLRDQGVSVDRTLISKIRRGKHVSIKDELNFAISTVLGINSDLLRVAAIKEKLSPDLVELLKKIG